MYYMRKMLYNVGNSPTASLANKREPSDNIKLTNYNTIHYGRDKSFNYHRRWRGHFLPKCGISFKPGNLAPPRIPIVVSHVPQPHSSPCKAIPCHRTRSTWIRIHDCAAGPKIQVHL